jgi:signal peptidase I
MNWTPTPWIAALLSAFSAIFGMLYVRRPWLALLFAVLGTILAVIDFAGLVTSEWLKGAAGIALWVAGIVLAYRLAKNAVPGAQPWYSRWYSLVGIPAGLALCLIAVRIFLYEPFIIPSTAMLPTYEVKTRIVVQKFGFGHLSSFGVDLGRMAPTATFKRGEVMVFDYPRDPKQTYVKRVIGLPGDVVIYRNKNVNVNGQETRVRQLDDYIVSEPTITTHRYLNRLGDTSFETIFYPKRSSDSTEAWNFPGVEHCTRSVEEIRCVVPAKQYFVMGDNRDNSHDSRFWGFVRSDQVVGKVVKAYNSQRLN